MVAGVNPSILHRSLTDDTTPAKIRISFSWMMVSWGGADRIEWSKCRCTSTRKRPDNPLNPACSIDLPITGLPYNINNYHDKKDRVISNDVLIVIVGEEENYWSSYHLYQ